MRMKRSPVRCSSRRPAGRGSRSAITPLCAAVLPFADGPFSVSLLGRVAECQNGGLSMLERKPSLRTFRQLFFVFSAGFLGAVLNCTVRTPSTRGSTPRTTPTRRVRPRCPTPSWAKYEKDHAKRLPPRRLLHLSQSHDSDRTTVSRHAYPFKRFRNHRA